MDENATPQKDVGELVIRVCIGILCVIGGLVLGLLVANSDPPSTNPLHAIEESPSIVSVLTLKPERTLDSGEAIHPVSVGIEDPPPTINFGGFLFRSTPPLEVTGNTIEANGRTIGGAQIFDDSGNRYLLVPIEGEPPVRVVVGVLDD